MQIRPWSDPENFNAGYVMRSQHVLFKQVSWLLLDHGSLTDAHLDLLRTRPG